MSDIALDFAQIEPVLAHGELAMLGQLPSGSNYSFLLNATYAGLSLPAVYKPARGEQPLWDFPAGTLAKRETAAYRVSNALGWQLVPPTVYRAGPYGDGSVQFFIDHDPEQHYFTFSPAQKQRLAPFVLFDYITNNADRKGGHLLLDSQENIWGIDHGLCFHPQYKLRTVIWDFIGQPIAATLCADLTTLLAALHSNALLCTQLSELLSINEIAAIRRRIRKLLKLAHYPAPVSGSRPYPWPAI